MNGNRKFRYLPYASILVRLPSWPTGEWVIKPFLEVNNAYGYWRVYPTKQGETCRICEVEIAANGMHDLGGSYCEKCGLAKMKIEWKR